MKKIPPEEFAVKFWAATAEVEAEHAEAGHPYQRVKNVELQAKLGLGKTAFQDYIKNGLPPRPRLVERRDDSDDVVEHTA